MKNNKKDFTTIMTNILLTLAVGCILTLLVYNVFFRKEDTKPQANYTFKEYYYQADIMPFELDSVLSMYEQDTLNIVIQYTYNDTIYDRIWQGGQSVQQQENYRRSQITEQQAAGFWGSHASKSP